MSLGRGLWVTPLFISRAISDSSEFIIMNILISLPFKCVFYLPVLQIFSNHFLNKFIYLFMHLFLAVFSLHCCIRVFSSCGKWGLLIIAIHRLLIAVASLVEHGLQACRAQQLWHVGSAVVAHGLSCSMACGILLDQGSNPCPLQWQVDS